MKTDPGEWAFWDTSALLPLCCRQPASSAMRRLARSHRRIIAWWGSSVEAHGALRRLVRDGALDEEGLTQALARLALLRRSWAEVQPHDQLRELATRVLDQSPLRSADALQLAAALVACGERPRRRPFVCLDDRLAVAAAQAGFTVLPAARR